MLLPFYLVILLFLHFFLNKANMVAAKIIFETQCVSYMRSNNHPIGSLSVFGGMDSTYKLIN